MAPRFLLRLLVAAVIVLPLLALVHGAYGAHRRHLAAADAAGGEHLRRQVGGVVVDVGQNTRDNAVAAAGRWAVTVRKGGGGHGGHGGHGHGRGHGRGRGRGHGTPETRTPAVFYPRAGGNGNYRHGRSAAAMTTGPGQPAARAMLVIAAAAVLLLHL